MIIARFFNGLSGSAFLSVAGGTVGDLFHRQELAALMRVYTASPFIGPEIGPLVGGFINTYTTRYPAHNSGRLSPVTDFVGAGHFTFS
ncbi:putative MFS multidrug transporter [Aspergillus fumigatus Af293]|uniref:MFS multidrug transporter, putative n=2 Tax=Aspergillus fumigatus TaxID=746128 RepID=Q4W970_ASPFU|nr:MFS multidrug transporter, putative [Aspergillus fumigatus Af293]EAL84371.1 MFS multidrug transporter, putative [Aspergillus fumigatus Af293]EDP47106.1 MFS multidrug transporter, putative [Aspergillus fumigatus A1163]KAH1499959.1 hypothetical protein KXX06_001601 [Aspergillus fumigatus]